MKLTPIEYYLCQNFYDHGYKYLARDEDQTICAYRCPPERRSDFWFVDRPMMFVIDERILSDTAFSFVKWNNTKPWAIEFLLKMNDEIYTEIKDKRISFLTPFEYEICKNLYDHGCRYLARDAESDIYRENRLCAYYNKPHKTTLHWVQDKHDSIVILSQSCLRWDSFFFIKWGDKEPLPIEHLLALEIKDEK